MKLYLVSTADGTPTWIAVTSGQDVYSYVPETGRFHVNEALGADFFMGDRSTYTELGTAEARRLIEAGEIGSLRDLPDLRADFEGKPQLDVDTVFAAVLTETDWAG